VYLATSPEVADVSGGYFVNAKRRSPSKAAQDADAARRLWAASEALVADAAASGGTVPTVVRPRPRLWTGRCAVSGRPRAN